MGGRSVLPWQGVPDRLPQAEGGAEEGGAGGDQAEAEGGAEEDEGGGSPTHISPPAFLGEGFPAPRHGGPGAGQPGGRGALRAPPAPLAGTRVCPGRSGRGAAVTLFHLSAAPRVPEDAEREGGGARYVLAGRRVSVSDILGWVIGAGARVPTHGPTSAPRSSHVPLGSWAVI